MFIIWVEYNIIIVFIVKFDKFCLFLVFNLVGGFGIIGIGEFWFVNGFNYIYFGEGC